MKQIPLTNGKFALVDDEDYEHLSQYKWHYDTNGYAARSYWICAKKPNRKMGREFIARVVMGNPEGMFIDHINGDTLDNRKQNLRALTNQQNTWNQKVSTRRKTATNHSKHKGVTHCERKRANSKPWRARIRVSDKVIELGYFNTEDDAAEAYNAAALKFFGEYARLNAV